jgi:hypothetical protein
MKTKHFYTILLSIFCFFIVGCTDNKDIEDVEDIEEECIEIKNYQEAILGKWELIEQGRDEDNMKPITSTGNYKYGDYMEFFSTGMMGFYNPETTEYYNHYSYRIDSLFLYEDPNTGQFPWIYKHCFYKKDKLKLTFVSGVMLDLPGLPLIFVYKHIK